MLNLFTFFNCRYIAFESVHLYTEPSSSNSGPVAGTTAGTAKNPERKENEKKNDFPHSTESFKAINMFAYVFMFTQQKHRKKEIEQKFRYK